MDKNSDNSIRDLLERELDHYSRNLHGFISTLALDPAVNKKPEKILALAKHQKDPFKKIMLGLLGTRILYQNARLDEAVSNALAIAENEKVDPSPRSYAYAMLADIFAKRNDFITAEKYGKTALGLAGKIEDDIFIFVLNNIGILHYYQERFALAFEYYETCAKVAERIGGSSQYIGVLVNSALALEFLGRDKEALERLFKVKRLAEEKGDKKSAAFVRNFLGVHYTNAGEYESAVPNLLEAVRLFDEMGMKLKLAECYYEMFRAYHGLKDAANALQYGQKAATLAEETGQKYILPQCYAAIAAAYASMKDPRAEENFRTCLKLFETLHLETDIVGIESAYLEYGKYLIDRDADKAAAYILRAVKILEKRSPTTWVKKTLSDARAIFAKIGKTPRPEDEAEVEKHKGLTVDFRKILEISKAINSETRTRNVLELVLDAALGLSGAERGLVALLEEGKRHYAVQRNIFRPVEQEPDFSAMDAVAARVLSSGKPLLAGSVLHSDAYKQAVPSAPDSIKAVFAFPLVLGTEAIGCIYLDSRFIAMELAGNTLDLLGALAEQATVAINKARLYDRVLELTEKLERKVERQSVELEATRRDLEIKRLALEERHSYSNIIGKSAPMRDVFDLLDKYVRTDLPVCIYGESGTGKELVARAIHYNGTRKKAHFVAINCAAIPETLLESELFGYEKGAFTGADGRKEGLFETASGGTLFLDEIGGMSPNMQQKILRVIQEKEVRRLGSGKNIPTDVRLIFASNKDLRDLVTKGLFREDLYYRINVLSLSLPPLRKRVEDIPLLFGHFWEKITGNRISGSTEGAGEVLRLFMNYDWPGNIRELENEVNRLAVLGGGALDVKYVSRNIAETARPAAGAEPLAGGDVSLPDMQRRMVVAALKKARGNKSKAAKLLGIPRTTVKYKMERFGITMKEIFAD
jgi:transcriptional regulator with GAF, ATPase, and Fis domain